MIICPSSNSSLERCILGEGKTYLSLSLHVHHFPRNGDSDQRRIGAQRFQAPGKLTEQEIEYEEESRLGEGRERKEGTRGSGYIYCGKDVQCKLPGDERLKEGANPRDGDEADIHIAASTTKLPLYLAAKGIYSFPFLFPNECSSSVIVSITHARTHGVFCISKPSGGGKFCILPDFAPLL